MTVSTSIRRAARLCAMLGIALVSTCGLAHAEPGDHKMLGKAGEWANTVAGATMGNTLYTLETSGILYSTNLATGTWKRVGSATFAKPKFLMAAGTSLFAVLGDGSLYKVSPGSGTKKRLGVAGAWKNAIKATSLGGQLYAVTSKGSLYRVGATNGKWQKLGKDEFGATVVIAGQEKSEYYPGGLFTIEKDGSLYKIDPTNGSWKPVGKAGGWSGTKAGAIISGINQIYTVNSKGALVHNNLSNGFEVPPTLGQPIYNKSTHLFAAGNNLYEIDSDGSLYAIEMEPTVS